MPRSKVTIDGNEAAAYVAFKTNEVAAIYPITPSSPMGELADAWSAAGERNIWGSVPDIVEMQSEGGAAGAVHGALQTGSLTTTFTASQGLLLMIPNMYKIAGELTSTVFQIAARSLAAQGLSIFGDHSDVMAARSTGWAMLFANSVQEVMDMALIAQASTLATRVPFLHVFDGFRTSHEVAKIEQLTDEDIRAMIDDDLVRAHRARALNPEKPVMRGTAQNPDIYFQARESANPFYAATPGIVQEQMDKFAGIVGRQYHLFDYEGAPDAERVIVIMGSGAEAVQETVEWLVARGEKVGMVKVRLFRPFSVEHFVQALPKSVRKIAVLDRTKEPGAAGEPLYQDVLTALAEGMMSGWAPFDKLPRVVGGRYGLSSKEFTPAMVKGIYDELTKTDPKNHFTIGIVDDVSHTSLDYDDSFSTEPKEVVRALFWGLGSDGTVGANKNSIKIIGEETNNYAQGYFVYDSKKSGARTVSHLRFGPKPIHSTYLIQKANFVGVHQFGFLERYDILGVAEEGGVLLLNSPYSADETWEHLPRIVQQQIIDRKLKVYVIDAYAVAADQGMAGRINTIMQTCFFAISGVLPREEAIEQIKYSIKKTYGKRGEAIVRRNYAAVDASLANMFEMKVPDKVTSAIELPPAVPGEAPAFVQDVTAMMIKGDGDLLPVSALPVDGTYPTATTQWEKRNIALEVPVWDPDVCIQCGKCVYVCPHAVIRSKLVDGETAGRCARTASSPPTPSGASSRTASTRCRSPWKIAPAASSASRSARPRTSRPSGARPSTWSRNCRSANRVRATGTSSQSCPKHSMSIRSSGTTSRMCSSAAALRVLRRVRRLWRDAVSQADQPALRRALRHRQRHGLLQHLRRQPADDALVGQPRRARPGLVEFALRGQRRVRSGHAGDARQAGQYARELVERLRNDIGADLADAAGQRRRRTTRPRSHAQRVRIEQLREQTGRQRQPGGTRPAQPGRQAGQEGCVDRRRRRLGL